MRLQFVNQPASDLLGDDVRALLRSGKTHRFWVASAWVRLPALRRIEQELKAFAARVKSADCRGLFGIDLGGTTQEGLQLAAQLFGEARVFHSVGVPWRSFHPKLYVFEGPSFATVAIGSSNLTAGGLWGNFEANVLIELDPRQPSDRRFLQEVRNWFLRWWSDPNGSRKITRAMINALAADPTVRLPREHEVRKILLTSVSGRSKRSGPSVFNKPVTGLKRVPKGPKGFAEPLGPEQPDTIVVPGLPLESIATPVKRDDLRVLVAAVPRDRWKQIGFNKEVSEDFFRVFANGDALWIQGVKQGGILLPPKRAALIYPSTSNQNHRIEFPEPDGRADPRPARPILVVLEQSFRTFRYVSLRPGDSGYKEMGLELARRPSYGVSRKPETKRVSMSYGELRAAWSGKCPLRP